MDSFLRSALTLLVCSLTVIQYVVSATDSTELDTVGQYAAGGDVDSVSGGNFIGVEPYYAPQPYFPDDLDLAKESNLAVQTRGKRFFSILSPADRLRTLYARSGRPKTAGGKVTSRNGFTGYSSTQK